MTYYNGCNIRVPLSNCTFFNGILWNAFTVFQRIIEFSLYYYYYSLVHTRAKGTFTKEKKKKNPIGATALCPNITTHALLRPKKYFSWSKANHCALGVIDVVCMRDRYIVHRRIRLCVYKSCPRYKIYLLQIVVKYVLVPWDIKMNSHKSQ
jgi:hypothetical protein